MITRLVIGIALLCCAVKAEYCFRPVQPDGSAVPEICVPDDFVRSREDPAAASPIDSGWLLICGILVFYMQAGFIMLEAGSVSRKNIVNIVFKNFMDACLGAIAWYLVGYSFAFGKKFGADNPFIGEGNFALVDELDDSISAYHEWWFQYAFAATASTIVSGSVAERAKLSMYFLYSVLMVSVVYPIVVHWVWDADGWLYKMGYIDFAGASVVHSVGGFTGLVGAWMLGPRLGRFKHDPSRKSFRPHSIIPQALGVSMLWFGWYGFNAGSTLALTEGQDRVASRVVVTTTLSASAAGVTAVFLGKFTRFGMKREQSWDLVLMLNGVLAGLVAITGPCATISPGFAVPVGVVAALAYVGASKLLVRLKIDDPLDAAPVHGACGLWGILATGFFSDKTRILLIRDEALGRGEQIGVQLLGAVAVAAWTVVTAYLMFKGLDKLIGIRVPKIIEQEGLDMHEHLINAYDVEDFVGGQPFLANKAQTIVDDDMGPHKRLNGRPSSPSSAANSRRLTTSAGIAERSGTATKSLDIEMADSRFAETPQRSRGDSFSMASEEAGGMESDSSEPV